MKTPNLHPSTPQVEKSFLKKAWWIFPVLGALVSLAIGGPFWAWVHAEPISIRWLDLFTLRTALCATASLCIPAIWWLGLRSRAKGWAVSLAVLGLVMGIELILHTSLVQKGILQASLARVDGRQYFLRDASTMQLQNLWPRDDATPAVVLVGSSRMEAGVNAGQLRKLLHPKPVIRRVVVGMTPFRAWSMYSYMPIQAGYICVLYLSEYDFTNQTEFPFAWFRPFASWRTLPNVSACVPRSILILHWRHWVDYVLAATVDFWRLRDFIGLIATRVSGTPYVVTLETNAELEARVRRAHTNLRFSGREWKAFQQFAKLVSAKQAKLLVFESEVHPSLHSDERTQIRNATRKQLYDFLESGFWHFVSIEEQAIHFSGDDWKDVIHLGPKGREKLTRRVAQELLAP